DPKQIAVQPWERNLIPAIEKAIMAANLGFNPQNNGEVIRILVPALTEERRKELAKKVKQEVENAKVNVRNVRRNTNNDVKNLKDAGVSEDEIKKLEADIQKLTDEFIAKADHYLEVKEKEIMTI
ncbi:MAG: ribosome recycling factor, partial [Lentimicrobiaceae bacterium]|nr:ribosome recycling factor [Lentimicrobiaceae bacterium]